ncbi:MAG: hypothetical protein M3O36_16790 [Myxococcota bacterium]|nr:hypothetical protein [Myxococcota bacterium]
MLTLLSCLVAAACGIASLRRLMWAVAPSSLDLRLLISALDPEGSRSWPSLREAVLERNDIDWERQLFVALSEPDEAARAAFVNEQLTELDWRVRRWARVPRVCANIAMSSGFLFGCIALLRTVAPAAESAGQPATASLVSALDALAGGIAGTSFCAAVHLRSRRAARERTLLVELFLQRLEPLARGSPAVG